MTKRLLSLTAFLLLTVTMFGHDFEVGGIYYNITSSSAPLTVAVTYQGTSYSEYKDEYTGAVTIPKTVTYGGKTYSVTSIGGHAFRSCSGMTSIAIPNSVTTIGQESFSECSSLQKVIVNDIAAWCRIAFGSNPLYNAHHLYSSETTEITKLVIPNTVTSISNYAFEGCNALTSLTIGNQVKSIGLCTFYKCTGLKSLTIPNSVTTIGQQAFYGCSGLTSLTIGSSVTTIGGEAFEYCSGLTSLVIPNSVKTIGYWAFNGCSSLTSVTIGNGVTTIENRILSDCPALTSIVVGANNATYDSRGNSNAIIEKATNTLVVGCKNTTIPNSVTSIGFWAFAYCSGLTSIAIPNSVTSIGSSAFYGCSGLTSIAIPNSVTSIGSSTFSGCSGLEKVIVNDLTAWCGINFDGSNSNPLSYAHHLYSNETQRLLIWSSPMA